MIDLITNRLRVHECPDTCAEMRSTAARLIETGDKAIQSLQTQLERANMLREKSDIISSKRVVEAEQDRRVIQRLRQERDVYAEVAGGQSVTQKVVEELGQITLTTVENYKRLEADSKALDQIEKIIDKLLCDSSIDDRNEANKALEAIHNLCFPEGDDGQEG